MDTVRKTILNRAILKKLLAGSFIFYALSGLTSLGNYFFYPIVARLVSVPEYGEIQFLVSMFAQLSVGFVVINLLAIIIGVTRKGEEQRQTIRALNAVATAFALIIATAGTLLIIANKDALSLESTPAVIWLGISLIANVPFTVMIGRLQGNGHFIASGVFSLASVLAKLILSIGLIALGWGVPGAIAGITLSLLGAWAAGELYSYKRHSSKPTTQLKIDIRLLSFIKYHAIAALVAMAILTFLSSADSIVSRIALSSVDAGHYASVATITKIILAAASPIMWLSLPAALEKSNRRVVAYLYVISAVCIMATVVFSLAPDFFTTVVVGINPLQYMDFVPLASLSMSLYAVAFLTVTVCICRSRIKTASIATAGGLAIYFAMYAILSLNNSPIPSSLIAQAAAALGIIIISFAAFYKGGSSSYTP